jgi:hypothetical protein
MPSVGGAGRAAGAGGGTNAALSSDAGGCVGVDARGREELGAEVALGATDAVGVGVEGGVGVGVEASVGRGVEVGVGLVVGVDEGTATGRVGVAGTSVGVRVGVSGISVGVRIGVRVLVPVGVAPRVGVSLGCGFAAAAMVISSEESDPTSDARTGSPERAPATDSSTRIKLLTTVDAVRQDIAVVSAQAARRGPLSASMVQRQLPAWGGPAVAVQLIWLAAQAVEWAPL